MSQRADEIRAQFEETFNVMVEKGWSPEAAAEKINSAFFAIAMRQCWDGWPKITVDPETKKATLDVEGWSQS